MKKLKVFLALATLCVGGVAMAKDATLRFGTNPEYPPFEYKTETGDVAGFDIDVANAICTELEKKCVFVSQSFDSLIPNLRLKRFDAIISSMDITEERQKHVAFSDPYYLNPSVFVTMKGSNVTVDDLTGKEIGVLNGSTHQQYIKSKFKDSNIKNYPQYPNAMSDLEIGRVNVVFGDEVVVAEYIKRNNELEVIGEQVNDPEFFGNGLAIAVLPKNTELLNEINGALAKIKEDGRYQAIYDKWFK
ncbi:arginine ABC transporter substrate-binding protein [Wohlfahrtiimonas chitiniclastica]|uniref:ABC transporter ar n=2 Tax=Wohlfahrtiimonas chitiniclastica TaxID=400946 RepID=L8XYV1_9GAMM|nr:transporter substrate-binding domain-containing protein [Wohlfahrtiimonas chitiniclastica]ELV09092.1 ABC transporter ar [Wohlfahrtiimonas chitiniclastica SH04]KZX37742.1 arginine ABC transporter substrate-binding protein [Wohlfahrtiimonas chitiniclastica]MBS7814680.1 transporter substrate-binding domain-containing protein [Wohlfahrtiimonas chitiniclastica]MBS7817168.1 transporter substrate-binding domain-containing protein [Wohlfahrtiimonas chitiniclastica]MBS7818898.1 transporter substrate